MITVLAENKDDRSVKAFIQLPTSKKELKFFFSDLGTDLDDEVNIQYAGTGLFRDLDEILFTKLFESKASGEEILFCEINLLSDLLDRMDKTQIIEYANILGEYNDGNTSPAMAYIISEAYDIVHTLEDKKSGKLSDV